MSRDRAAERWAVLVRERLDEMERLRPGAGDAGPDLWDRRAEAYAGRVGVADADHPLVARVRRHVDADSTVVDAGAGSGRIALALAPHVRRVTAVDHSRGMLDLLEAEAGRRGLTNVVTVHAPWERTDLAADVAVCSYVIPKVADVAPFLRRLDAAASRQVLVEMGGLDGGFELDPLWRHLHGSRRAPQPTYLDAVDVLAGLGIRARAEVAALPARGFRDLAGAVEHHLDALLLDDQRRGELEGLLRGWLQRRHEGWWPPVGRRPTAIVTWAPVSRP